MLLTESKLSFFPPGGPVASAAHAGFRFGPKGTHSSRTLMFSDVATVLASAPADADRQMYARAIIDENCLAKPTVSTRRLSNQRLGELYALDPSCPLFRVFRRLWTVDEATRPLLALLAALARDPLLRASAESILTLPTGAELPRGPLREALRVVVGERMNDAVLEKVARNVASSWTQTGHLAGRTFKTRTRAGAGPAALAFALYLGHASGFRGEELLRTGWVAALDCGAGAARTLALEAKRLGLVDLRIAAGSFELDLERLDPRPERA